MTTSATPHRWIALAGTGFVLATLILAGPRVAAFERYNDGCNICHGAFNGPMSPRGTKFPGGSKHTMHRGSQYMNTSCNLCHSKGDDHNPFTRFSNGTNNNPGVGCTGCHGRDYGGDIGNSGVGLRAHHFANGIDLCASCHGDEPQPLPESAVPTYYGTPDTNVDDPCNAPPMFMENWSIGDTIGLDNDGDNLYDAEDPDCGEPCPWDLDGNNNISVGDLLILLGAWGPNPGHPADFDDNGNVGVSDLLVLLANWGPCP